MNRKKFMLGITTGLFILGMAEGVMANGFEEYNDYINEDGTYSYYFEDQNVFVTMDQEWYQNTRVVTDISSATFYHTDSQTKYEEEGVTGGVLFTVEYCVNDDYKAFPDYTVLGLDEKEAVTYIAVKPTDYQAYTGDAAIQAEYDSLWASVDDVIASIEVPGQAENGEVAAEGGAAGEVAAIRNAMQDVEDSANTIEAPDTTAPDGQHTMDEFTSVNFEETDASFEGTWVTFGYGFKIYVPEGWSTYVAAAGDTEGNIFLAYAEDNSKALQVSYTLGQNLDAFTIKEELEKKGTLQMINLVYLNNAIPAVTFAVKDGAEGAEGIRFVGSDQMTAFTVMYCSDDIVNDSYGETIIRSVSGV